MPSSPEQTLDLAAGSLIDLARARYDAAWHQSLLSGGPPPDRTEFLGGIADGRDTLVAVFDSIDGAYERLRELVRSGQATLSPVGPVPKAAGSTMTPSPYADTLDPVAAGRKPDVEASWSSLYAQTMDPPPAEERPQAGSPLAEGATVGAYELLGVIAHGGMGVVYKARHTRLDRLAAIKMVLAGAHASSEHLARFRAESQVVARLAHPNIVQLYEVGEQDNLPYIALEFVDGCSLANKAGGRPQDPREAAALVEVLARAVDYAHSKGVVHRDLKPSNVMLTAGGVPKVTDFGLAKRLEGDSGQTRSGTLMGTPSYMAPEQAAGWVHAIGPRTDVYALGAVLYELLTGVPPFSGANPLETIVAVLKNDPVPPSRLRPDIPRDLETICLKCLVKEQPKRYPSAAELADDLRRFLAGEAIRARPVGRAERLWRWCRRHPGVAALTAAVFLLLTAVAGVATTAAVRVRAEKQLAEDSAASAREAQTRAEGALAETERQKAFAEKQKEIAERNEKAALTAKTQAEQAMAAAEAARQRAESAETVAAEQLERALRTLGDFVSTVQNRLDNAPGTQQVKKDLLQLALRELRTMSGTAKKAGAVDLRMVEGYRRLGELAQRLGDLTFARQQFEEMDRVARQHADANPDDLASKRVVSVADVKLGDLCALTGDRAGARKHYEDARRIRAALAPVGGAAAKVDLAQILTKLGALSDPDPAVGLLKEALALREELLKPNPRDPNARRDVRASHDKLAETYLEKSDPAAARPHALEAVSIAEGLVKDYPKSPLLAKEFAFARYHLGNVYRAEKRPDDARKEYDEALRLIAPLATQNLQDLEYQVNHGLFLAHVGRHADAARIAARLREQAPRNAFLMYNTACVYAVAAEVAGEKPVGDLTPEEQKLIDGYSEAALGCLKAAVAAGFADHDLMRTDPELATVRKLPGFAEVAKGLRLPKPDR